MGSIVFVIVIAVFVLVTEITFKPRLDYARDGKLLLWYGVVKRDFVEILNLNK